MSALRITQIGNSVGVILPKEILARLKLESALSRPPNLAAYGTPDMAELAAAYAYGLAKNHPFVDGNKRAAFLAAGLFLGLNGWRLTASQAEATVAVFGLAAGEVDEPAFAAWLKDRMVRR